MKRILLLSLICSFSVFLTYGQNKYLSFEKGERILINEETIPLRTVNNMTTAGVEIKYEFTGAVISYTEVNNTAYNFIHIDGFANMSRVGAPALPSNNDIIALPSGCNPVIEILETEYEEYTGYMIHPALQPATDTHGDPEPEFEIDSLLYNTNEFYPKKIVNLGQIQYLRETPLAFLSVRPVQFNPVTKTLRVYTKIKYKITYSGGNKSFTNIATNNSIHHTNILKSYILNYKSIPDGKEYKDFSSKAGEKNYIIITHSEYIDAANDLANWKRQLGYSIEVVSQSSWTTTQIKDAVHNRYNTWTPKPDYFVIIGDHTGSYALPGEIYHPPSSSDDFATDLYYACMNGSGDYIPDMAHGRISVRTAAEAQIVVDKIINYEKNPTTDVSFYTTATHCAMFQESSTDGYAERRFAQTAEECLDYMNGTMGYNVNRVYKTDNTVSPTNWNNGYYSNGEPIPAYLLKPGFAWDGDKIDIKAEVDAGRFYLLHRDHGYVGGVGWADPQYLTSDISSLANGDMLPVIFSMNCHTGEYQLDNCFAEEFIRVQNKGAVGVIAAAYYSISGYNDALTIGMFDAIWPGFEPNFTGTGHTGTPPYPSYSAVYTMGDVLNQGLLRMTQSWGDNWGCEEYEHELFHYFGDPAMKIWTANPHSNTITATHPASVDCAGTTFAVTGSTAGATATLVYNNELIGEAVLDGSGNGTINYSITTPGTTVIFTVSKHNCVIYTVDLPLSGSCNFPPAVITNAATAVTTNSATLNGNITDDFGSTVTESGFVYSLSTNPLIGGGGVTQVQTSPLVTLGVFNEGITGLSSMTTYYYKAYAINANGTSYGDETAFTTGCGINTIYPFTEGFEGASFPPDCWDYYRGTNGLGTLYDWETSTTANSGSNAAYVRFENVSGGDAEDWLVTPQLQLGTSSQMTFYERQQYSSNYGTNYYIKVSTTSQTDQSSFTTLVTYDETGLTISYAQRTVDLSSYDGQAIYIAFVMVQDDGDNWYIDDINIDCSSVGTSGLWTGTTSTDWNTTTNWDDGNIPTASVNVVIPASCSNYPSVDETANCQNLNINDGGSLIVTTSGALTVNGNLQTGDGTSGSFTINNGTCTITGDYCTETGSSTTVSGGTFEFTNWKKSDDTYAKGTVALSGGTINISNSAYFSADDMTGSMTGDFIMNVGDNLQLDNTSWTTVTGGTINMTGSFDDWSFVVPTTPGGTFVAYNLTLNDTNGDNFYFCFGTENCDLDIKNNFTVENGNARFVNGPGKIENCVLKNVIIESDGILYCDGTNDADINVSGNWTNNSGTFTPGTNTVTLNGTNQSILGSTTFYNLTKSVTSAATLTFEASETQTVTNTTTLNGAASNLLSLVSSSVSTQWNLDPQGTRTISYVNVQDGNNLTLPIIDPANSVDNGNNTNWFSVIAISWNGSVSSDWQTTANWTPEQIPASSNDLTVPNGCPNYPVIDNGIGNVAECNNITVENSSSLTINPNGYMTVSGSITNNAGSAGLLINSDAGGTGSLIQNTSGNVDATVQLYFDASPEQWHMLSSPINNAPLSLLPTTNNLYFYDESTDDFWIGNTYGSGSVSGWTSPTGNLENNLGYLYYYYQTTLNFTGQLNDNTSTSSISVPYTNHGDDAPNGSSYDNFDGWNFIGNPYTSAVDWTVADAGAANLYDAVYFYDGTTFKSWVNGTDSWDGVSTNGGSQYIPAMQGFFVKGNIALGTGGTLNIPASARVHNDQAFWKNKYDETPQDFLRMTVEADGYTDEAIVRFLAPATYELDDKMDAYKRLSLNDAVPQIYTNASGETEYSINSIPYFDNSVCIPVKFYNTGESYSLNFTEFNFPDIKVYLRDNLLGETIEAGLDDSFYLTAHESDDLDRFELVFEKTQTSVPKAFNTSVVLFPNPNTGTFRLTVGNNASGFTVEITNVTGQIVYKNTFENNITKEIKMKSQSKGVYFVKIKFCDNSVINKKIIVE